ncbi:MAG: AlkZ family DNA glycosylase [Chloroflexi bacterium]|nr:AlkZ family DNA glycosylase [Chloroflexota bacterium]
MSVEERRARLAVRQHLAPAERAATPDEVAEDLVGLHGTDPASVYLSALARLRTPATQAVDAALYETRSLVRMLGMRRTMFVLPRKLAPIVQSACTSAIAAQERRRLLALLEEAEVAEDAAAWLADVEQATLAELERRGEATALELGQVEPRLRHQLLFAQGKSYAGSQSVSTRILFLLAAEGRLIRGRPRGTWISSQFRWSALDAWLGAPLEPWPRPAAQAELVRRWLVGYGPGTGTDLRWWTGLTVRDVRRALDAVGAVEVDLDGKPGMALPGELAPSAPPDPWAALLPALDPAVMGWLERDWFLGSYGPLLFDRSGNVGPTVWLDGRVVGGWAQAADGEIRVRLLEDVGTDASAAIADAAEAVRTSVGPVRVTPRFRTPLERQLSA